MKRRFAWLAAGLLLLSFAGSAFAQDRAWKEGSVVNVSSIRVVDGQFENYMDYLSKNWKPVMEEAKKAGYILEYGIYTASPKTPQEPDLYLVVTYPNMAALDGMFEKMQPIQQKVTNLGFREADEASGKRIVMRQLLGEEMLRQIELK